MMNDKAIEAAARAAEQVDAERIPRPFERYQEYARAAITAYLAAMKADEVMQIERATVKRLVALARLATIRQVLDAGEPTITQSGVSPWCVSEGLADGHEKALPWWVEEEVNRMIAAANPHEGGNNE